MFTLRHHNKAHNQVRFTEELAPETQPCISFSKTGEPGFLRFVRFVRKNLFNIFKRRN